MARITYLYPIESIQGKLNKNEHKGATCRQKHYRDENGKIIGTAKAETYVVKYPRDYKKNPPQGTELANITAFQQAALRVKEELANPERRAYWTTRWHAQLKKGEKDAPISPVTHKPKIYQRFDKFVLAALMREIKKKQ